jgi:hypothetical protein
VRVWEKSVGLACKERVFKRKDDGEGDNCIGSVSGLLEGTKYARLYDVCIISVLQKRSIGNFIIFAQQMHNIC